MVKTLRMKKGTMKRIRTKKVILLYFATLINNTLLPLSFVSFIFLCRE